MDFSSPRYPPPATDIERDVRLLADVCGEFVTQTDTGWRNELARHPDPERLAATADQHGVLPLLARAVSLAGLPGEALRARAREIALRNLALALELVRLLSALRGLGIEALAYKGPVLAQQLYGDLTLRQFRDLDILIAPTDVLRTRDALCRLGYNEFEQFSRPFLSKHVSSQCEWQMRGTTSGTTIELHWALFPRYASFDLSLMELRQATPIIEIAGEGVRAIDFRHLALVLGAHGTKHFWHRLGWLVDFALVLRSVTSNAEKVLDDAAAKGMTRILLVSSILASRVFRVKLPSAFEAAVDSDRRARLLADDMQQFLFAGAGPADLLSENVFLLRSRERWSDRVKVVSRLAFTPGPEEWRWVVLPEWAAWLYRPLRLARAARYLPRIVERALSSKAKL